MKWLRHPAVGIVLLLSFFGCSRRHEASPTQVVKSVWKAGKEGKTDEIRRLFYIAPGETESVTAKRVQMMVPSLDERGIALALLVSRKVEYERVLDDGTAEVGVALRAGPTRKRIPFQQVILRQQDGVWKYDKSTYDLTVEELEARIKRNARDASAYYLLGTQFQPDNPVKAESYFRKYWELEPRGFWVDADFKRRMQEATDDVEKRVTKLLDAARPMPPTSPNRSMIYGNIARMYMVAGKPDKARQYIEMAKPILQASPAPTVKQILADVEREFQECFGQKAPPNAGSAAQRTP